MKTKLLESAWQDYFRKILSPLPIMVGSIQYYECRKAFYAGAGGVLDAILKTLEPGAEPTESDLAIMDGIQEELTQFVLDPKNRAGA